PQTVGPSRPAGGDGGILVAPDSQSLTANDIDALDGYPCCRCLIGQNLQSVALALLAVGGPRGDHDETATGLQRLLRQRLANLALQPCWRPRSAGLELPARVRLAKPVVLGRGFCGPAVTPVILGLVLRVDADLGQRRARA